MKRRTILALIALAITAPIIIHAKVIEFEGRDYDFNRPESEIAQYEEKRAKEEMETIYNMIMDAYGENEKNKWLNPDELTDAINNLQLSQRAWIKYYDAEISCEVKLLYVGGLPQSTAFSKRSTELTKQRIARLKNLLEDAHQYLEENAYRYVEEDYHLKQRSKRAKHDIETIKKIEAEEPPPIIKNLKTQLKIDNSCHGVE